MGKRLSIANEWKWVSLKEISHSIQYGYTESSSKEMIGPKFLRITDIQDNKVIWDDVPYCRIDEDTKAKYLLKDGDLVFARTGATVGKSFLIKGEIPEAVFASYLIRVRTNELVDQKYLYNFFQSSIYWRQITEGQVGIGQPNVNGTKLGQLQLPVPPKLTQQAIASKIEELFSELDKAIENLQLAQQQLKTYRQSVLKWAFEGKLTEEWRSRVRVPSSPQTVSMASEEQREYGSKLPEGWKWNNISALATNLDGKRIPLSKEVRSKRKGTFRYYGATEIVDYINDYIFDGEYLLIGEDGANLLSKARPLAFTVEGKFWVNNHAHVLQAQEETSNKYLCYYFNSLNLAPFVTGTAQPKLTQSNLNKIPVPIGSIKEQQGIVEEIENRLSVADKMEESISQSLQQAEALRQSILKKAFEGKLVL